MAMRPANIAYIGGRSLVIGAVVAGYAATTALIAFHVVVPWDLATRDWLSQHSPPVISEVSAVAAHIAQGGPLSIIVLGLALYAVRRYRTTKPLFQWLAAMVLLAVVVSAPKVFFRRGAPGDPQWDAVEFFSKPFCGNPACQSYPSGHVANAVLWYGLALLFLGSLVEARVGRTVWKFIVIVAGIATVLAGYHWISDTIAGLLAGCTVYLTVRAINDSDRMNRIVQAIDSRLGFRRKGV